MCSGMFEILSREISATPSREVASSGLPDAGVDVAVIGFVLVGDPPAGVLVVRGEVDAKRIPAPTGASWVIPKRRFLVVARRIGDTFFERSDRARDGPYCMDEEEN